MTQEASEHPTDAGAEQASPVPHPPPSGDAGVDAALTALRDDLTESGADRVAAFEAAHRALQDRLADVEG